MSGERNQALPKVIHTQPGSLILTQTAYTHTVNINSVLAAFTTYANYAGVLALQPDSSKTSFLSNVPTTALSFFTPQEAQGKILLQTTGLQPFSLVSAAELGSWKSRTLATFHHAFPHWEYSNFYHPGSVLVRPLLEVQISASFSSWMRHRARVAMTFSGDQHTYCYLSWQWTPGSRLCHVPTAYFQ